MAHAFFLMLLVNASWAFLLPVKPRCRVLCSAAETPDEFSFSALRREAEKRRAQEGLGKFDLMRKIGPHHTTSPKEVVEHVVMELRAGELSQAFAFTSMPPWRQGTHKSCTDWTQRMAWDRATIINGQPSGMILTFDNFVQMVRTQYAQLLQTDQYRFLGDHSDWQQKQGQEAMTAEKERTLLSTSSLSAFAECVVEVRTKNGEHILVKFRLVYDWLVHCHLVAMVSLLSATNGKHFPGEDDFTLGI